MNGLDDIYITLPSWSSQTLFPHNIDADFCVKLSRKIDLKGDWKVGLRSFNVQKNWYNVVKENNFVQVKTDKYPSGVHCAIQTGCYDDIGTLTNALNDSMKEYFEDKLSFGYDNVKKKVYFKVAEMDMVSVTFANDLGRMLGFTIGHHLGFSQYARNGVNLDGDKEYIFIMCDVGEEQIVGNIELPLLSTIYTGGYKYGESLSNDNEVSYVNVKNKCFEVIHIWIVDIKGNIVNFVPSNITFGLHFFRK